MHPLRRKLSRHLPIAIIALVPLLAPAVPAGVRAEWLPDGSPVCTLAGNQSALATTSDDASGLYLVWSDARTGTSRLYAQHLDANGDPRWDADGVPVSLAGSGSMDDHRICTDGDGELWVTWTAGSFVLLEHLDATGEPDFHGSLPYPLSTSGYSPVCAPDGAGGVIVAWCSSQAGTDQVLAARVGPGGDFDPAGSATVGEVVSDGCSLSIAANEPPGEGIFLAWTDCTANGYGIVQWVGTDLAPNWGGATGLELPSLTGGWIEVADRQGTGGGAYALCSQAGVSSYDGLDVYSVTESGSITVRGVDSMDTTERRYYSGRVLDNGHGGFFCVWAVYFWPCECYQGIYAKNIDYDGSVIWGPTVLPYSSFASGGGLDAAVLTDRDRLFVSWPGGTQLEYGTLDWATGTAGGSYEVPGGQSDLEPRLVASDLGGTGTGMRPLIAWLDERGDDIDIYANNLDADWPDTNVIGLYTEGDGTGVDFMWVAEGEPTLYLCLTDYHETSDLAGWECALDLPPNAWHVSTVLSGGGVNASTAPGYVVDLASPLPPAATMVLAEITLHVTNRDPSVIRLTPVASPCLADQMALVTADDPGTCQPLEWASGAPGAPVFYLNSSPLSAAAGPAPARHRLLGASPNPFNPRTAIHYELAGPATVSLRVYDLAGRLVRTLKDGVREGAGRHATDWDGRDGRGRAVAAGVYLCRLTAGAASRSGRMVLVR